MVALRLLVEDLETATATPDLLGGKKQNDTTALAALRPSLSARFGPRIITTGAERPQNARAERRAAHVAAHWQRQP